MRPTVTIVDYGMGNLYSVSRALEVSGAVVAYASSPEQIVAADHLVLPGVGAFESGMAGLRERSLVAAIRVHALAGKPLLGICLGMQMLATVSEEFGEHEGLDLIPGRVVPIPATTLEGVPQKTPHVGWSALHKAPGAEWVKTPLEDIHAGASVYLVHSFAVRTIDPIHTIAFCQIGGHPVCAAIRSGAMIGCQFHPEKSGSVGLAILKKFIES